VGNLPLVRARQVVAALQRAGFVVHHQTGSHVVLKRASDRPRRTTVPMHAGDVKRGTLRAILREAGISEEEFLRLL
jgi:mRNA interferase HicA